MVLFKVGVALARIGVALFEVGVARATPKVYKSPPLYTTRIDGSSLRLQFRDVYANQDVWAGSVGSSGRVMEGIWRISTVD